MDSEEPLIKIYKTTEELLELLRSAREDPQVDVIMVEGPRKPGKTDLLGVLLRDLMIKKHQPTVSQVEIDSMDAILSIMRRDRDRDGDGDGIARSASP
jgi:predicted AAA+ superfamily ATPase